MQMHWNSACFNKKLFVQAVCFHLWSRAYRHTFQADLPVDHAAKAASQACVKQLLGLTEKPAAQNRLTGPLREMHLHQSSDLLVAFKTSGCTVRQSNVDALCQVYGPVMKHQISGQLTRHFCLRKTLLSMGCKSCKDCNLDCNARLYPFRKH